VSLTVGRGETLGLVGESGCGKSTLGRAVLQLRRPAAGKVVFDGTDLTLLSGEALRLMRRRLQLIFQDPISSLNPRRRIGDIVAEPLLITGVADRTERERRVHEVLSEVGLDPDQTRGRLPHEFSGGQCQRICIARALILEPELVICDEPVSALDVSIQAQVLNLLDDLQQQLGLAYLFISHDLGVVRHIAHEVLVMYLGHAVEQGSKKTLFTQPLHPYTQALLASTPGIVGSGAAKKRIVLNGELPSPLDPPSGCVFSTRCPEAVARCHTKRPVLRELAGRQVACHEAEKFIQPAAEQL
jgi:oligopeptide/dipeptide ABC transporter ATP-binding protein